MKRRDRSDFHLTPGSPMVDAGDPGMSTFMVFDLDDDPRTLDGNCDGPTRPDIGADELLRDCTPGTRPGGGPGGPQAAAATRARSRSARRAGS